MGLRDEVLALLNVLFERNGVAEDPDGDFEVDLGERTCWVRVYDKPAAITVFAPVAADVPRGQTVDDSLLEFNRTFILFRAFWEEEQVVLRADLIAAPLVAQQLQTVLDDFSSVAGQLAEESQAWSRF